MCGICVRMATRTELYIDTLGGLDLDGSTDKNLQYFVVENLATLPDSSRTSSTMSASQECGVRNHLRYDTRCYFNVCSKADILCQLNPQHGNQQLRTNKKKIFFSRTHSTDFPYPFFYFLVFFCFPLLSCRFRSMR